ncbi:MAG TPA: phosphatase PAP2 family protein [Bacteroidota bacterium]|nr:phosphatase PAP2 family protein [Bacteroidota bacterium]
MRITPPSWFVRLTTSDLATMVFLSLLSILSAVFASSIPQWYGIIICNLCLIFLIPYVAVKAKKGGSRTMQHIRDWYPVPMILYVFKLTYLMVHPIHPQDFDWLLIDVDRWIFGTDPTGWILQFARPAVTEILQVCYACYYFILLSVFFELWWEKRHTEFFLGAFLVVYGFYLSYIGYLAVPAVGPRFTLHDFDTINQVLPGLWLTDSLRDFLNSGESIPRHAANAIALAQRDAFPSGHTELTLVSLYIAFSNRLKSRWVLLVIGSLLIVSTVYLWYHYVIDVIAGVCLFAFTVWSGRRMDSLWRAYKARLKSVRGEEIG